MRTDGSRARWCADSTLIGRGIDQSDGGQLAVPRKKWRAGGNAKRAHRAFVFFFRTPFALHVSFVMERGIDSHGKNAQKNGTRFFHCSVCCFFLKSNRKLDQTWYQSDIWKWNRVKSVNTENYLGTAWMLSNMIKSSKEKLGKTLWNSVRAAFNPVKRGKTVEETR